MLALLPLDLRHEVYEVAAPDEPGVCAFGLDVFMVDVFRFEPGDEILILFEEEVAFAAGDPEEFDAGVVFLAQGGEGFIRFAEDPRRGFRRRPWRGPRWRAVTRWHRRLVLLNGS